MPELGYHNIKSHMQNKLKPGVLWVLISIVLLSLIHLGMSPASASVTLLYFEAAPGDGEVLLEWETATEIDHAGFFVSRSTDPDADFTQIGNFIPAEGDSITGAWYYYEDLEVENGVTYYYVLESWNIDNVTVDYTDPISATPGLPTPTPTETDITTATVTRTSTPGPSRTPTTTLTRTSTPVPTGTATATPTLENTATVTPLPTITLTEIPTSTLVPTLLPLLTIVIVYPTEVPTITPSLTPTEVETQQPVDDLMLTGLRIIAPVGMVCMAVLLWVMLGIGLFFLLRRWKI